MNEPIWIWEITIPQKIEYKLYQACLMVGIDISNTDELWFSDYMRINKCGYNGIYADVIVSCTDKTMHVLYKKLVDLEAENTDMWILDEVIDEIEEENESWQNQ